MWLIGLDENKKAVTGADDTEFANWWPKVVAEFQDVYPQLAYHINVPVDGLTVSAMLFETDRAPFLIKNPVAGQPHGGPVELEVPWREGTRIRSARRSELLRMLATQVTLPEVQVRYCQLTLKRTRSDVPMRQWYLHADLYVIPSRDQSIVIPYHQCGLTFEIDGVIDEITMSQVDLDDYSSSRKPKSKNEVIVDNPKLLKLTGSASLPLKSDDYTGHKARVVLMLSPVQTDRSIRITLTLPSVPNMDPDTSGTVQPRWNVPIGRWRVESPNDAVVSYPEI